MIATGDFGALVGAPVLGPNNEKIGTVGQIFVDPASGRPNWMTVRTGSIRMSESFVPLDPADGADWADAANGGDERVRISYDKDFITSAPRVGADGAPSESEEDELNRYYGISRTEGGNRPPIGAIAVTGTVDDPTAGSPSAHMDTDSGPDSDRPTGSDYGDTGTGRMGA